MKNSIKRLPDTEFSVMKAIWRCEEPITTHKIMERMNEGIEWKPQTLLTILARLSEKGFIRSDRVGRERSYHAMISEKEYLQIETGSFLKRYSGNSLGGLVKALYSEGELSREDLSELKEWLMNKE